MSDGFLARWSRRKRDEARRPPEAAPEAASAEPAPAPVADDEGSLSPEELAQLPSLDALTAATDLTPFLRAGVPRTLRNAALRRMWSVDPAIRDFVSEAREYAYDWNIPGGVPGTGGLISAEEVRAMVERVFGGGEETSPTVADQSDVADPVALSSSLRGQGEILGIGAIRSPLAGGAARPNGEGKVPNEISPPPLPPQRVGPAGIDAPPLASDIGGGTVSPLAGRGDAHDCREPQHAAPLPAPPRLRRHGGALPI